MKLLTSSSAMDFQAAAHAAFACHPESCNLFTGSVLNEVVDPTARVSLTIEDWVSISRHRVELFCISIKKYTSKVKRLDP